MTECPCARIAAIVPAADSAIDTLVADFAARLQKQGYAVHGLLQELICGGDECDIALRDVCSGELHRVTQDLGSGSDACRLDTVALTELARVYRQLAPNATDLVIFNRFGKLEAGGAGFHAELLDVMAAEMTVLTIVPPQHLARWREFTGGLGVELPPDGATLAAWFASLQSRR